MTQNKRKICSLDRKIVSRKKIFCTTYKQERNATHEVMTSEVLENANSINLMKRKVKKFLTRLATTALPLVYVVSDVEQHKSRGEMFFLSCEK